MKKKEKTYSVKEIATMIKQPPRTIQFLCKSMKVGKMGAWPLSPYIITKKDLRVIKEYYKYKKMFKDLSKLKG